MIDREKVLVILQKRFPGTSADQVAAAANAIVGLDDDWEEIIGREGEMGWNFSIQCGEICYLADEIKKGAEVRLFMRRRTVA